MDEDSDRPVREYFSNLNKKSSNFIHQKELGTTAFFSDLYTENLFEEVHSKRNEFLRFINRVRNDRLFMNATPNELEKIIKKNSTNSSHGIDELGYGFYKRIKLLLAPFLAKIINELFINNNSLANKKKKVAIALIKKKEV